MAPFGVLVKHFHDEFNLLHLQSASNSRVKNLTFVVLKLRSLLWEKEKILRIQRDRIRKASVKFADTRSGWEESIHWVDTRPFHWCNFSVLVVDHDVMASCKSSEVRDEILCSKKHQSL